jgi:hypothetical protein
MPKKKKGKSRGAKADDFDDMIAEFQAADLSAAVASGKSTTASSLYSTSSSSSSSSSS